MTSEADRPLGVPRGVRGALAMLALGLITVSCGRPVPHAQIRLTGPTMGTKWAVTLVPGPDGLSAVDRASVDGDVRNLLAEIERLMSTWNAASELSRFNQSRSTAAVAVSPSTFEVFQWAKRLAKESDGALDVTVSPLLRAWGFGADVNPSMHAPTEATLEALRARTGIELVELEETGRRVRKLRPDVECDFSSIAPGYAADRIAELLATRGLGGYLVDVGGELVARGVSARGERWRVGIEQPGNGRVARVVTLHEMAVATSGDYRNYREVDGERVTHIIDPRTARPVRHRLASVTVLDPRAVRADGLATALMVLGPEEGLALARRLNLPALFIVSATDGTFEPHATSRFEQLAGAE